MSVLCQGADVAVRWSMAERVAALKRIDPQAGHTSRALEDGSRKSFLTAVAAVVWGALVRHIRAVLIGGNPRRFSYSFQHTTRPARQSPTSPTTNSPDRSIGRLKCGLPKQDSLGQSMQFSPLPRPVEEANARRRR